MSSRRREDEAMRAAGLRDELAAALESGAPVSASSIVAVAAYLPLSSVLASGRLLNKVWPAEWSKAVLMQRRSGSLWKRRGCAPPFRGRQLKMPLPGWFSRQYEDNPYPRWVAAGTAGVPEEPTGPSASGISFCRCGAGWLQRRRRHGGGGPRYAAAMPIETARSSKARRMLAVDLGLGSLAPCAA